MTSESILNTATPRQGENRLVTICCVAIGVAALGGLLWADVLQLPRSADGEFQLTASIALRAVCYASIATIFIVLSLARPQAAVNESVTYATHDSDNPLGETTRASPEADIHHRFLNWLRVGIADKSIKLNNPASPVHIVPEGVFILAPGVFKYYCQQQGLPTSYHKMLSKRFDRLKKNIKTNNGTNIHTYWVKSGAHFKRMNGRVLPFDVIFDRGQPLPGTNKYIRKHVCSCAADAATIASRDEASKI